MRILLAGLAVSVLLPFSAHAQSASPGCRYTGGAANLALGGRVFAVQPTADGCWLFASVTGGPDAAPGIAALRNEGGTFKVVRRASAPAGLAGMALSHDGRLLAVAANDRLLLLDVAKLEAGDLAPTLAQVPEGEGAGAFEPVFSLDDRLLFVSEERRERLIVIDVAKAEARAGDGAIVSHIPQGRAPTGLALSADGAVLYATSELAPDGARFPRRCAPQNGRAGAEQSVGVLFAIDVARAVKDPDKAVVAAANAGCGPVRVALSPNGATVWVSARGDNALLSFPAASLRGIQAEPKSVNHPVGTAPVGVAMRPDGAEVWVSNSDRFASASQGTLSAVSTGGAPTRTVASSAFPRDMAFLPDGKTLVVAVFGSGALQFVPTDRP